MARHPAHGKTHEQIRELLLLLLLLLLLAVLVDGTPGPIRSSPMVRHHNMVDLHHPDAAGR